jgi:class 3 adenylate cyclase
VSKPRTRYARNGDVSLAYQVVADGPFDVVLVPGFVSNVEHYWDMPVVPQLLEWMSSYSRLIIYDKRGTGMSDPVSSVPAVEERMEDLRAVMDAAGSDQAALFGISEGGPMAITFAATYPHRVSSLVLYGTCPRFSRAPDYEAGWTEAQAGWMLRQIEEDWGEGALLDAFVPSAAEDAGMRELWGAYQRAGASPGMGRAVLEALGAIDVRAVLPSVQAPTLIPHRTGERVANVEGARLMAEQIPDARLIEFPGDDHLPFVGDYESIWEEIEEFLTGRRRERVPDRVLATVLFTDIVGSTERAAELGDRRWRALLDEHDAAVRRQLDRYRGVEIKSTGDGFLATFDGPARAIDCARAIRESVRQTGLRIRAGLHTGECELRGPDVGGVAVHIGARVAARAGADEVLVSSTVKDLVFGSGIEFADRGAHELKGVPGEWRLYAVED